MTADCERVVEFDQFVRLHEERLRVALVTVYGPEDGRDAAASALAWAWEHWDRVRDMRNPAGYLYRVGQSAGRPRKRRPVLPEPPPDGPMVEPGLVPALAALTENQRVALLLVEGYGWTLADTADLLEISVSSVRNHVRRGLERVRRTMIGEVEIDV